MSSCSRSTTFRSSRNFLERASPLGLPDLRDRARRRIPPCALRPSGRAWPFANSLSSSCDCTAKSPAAYLRTCGVHLSIMRPDADRVVLEFLEAQQLIVRKRSVGIGDSEPFSIDVKLLSHDRARCVWYRIVPCAVRPSRAANGWAIFSILPGSRWPAASRRRFARRRGRRAARW